MRIWTLLPLGILSLMLGVVGLSAPSPFEHRQAAHEDRNAQPVAAWHRELGHGYFVVMYLALPLAGFLPLVMSWKHLRRRVLAVLFMITGLLGVAGFSLLTSFTGFMIGRGDWVHDERGKEGLLRMKALHVLGFPILLVLAFVYVWIVSLRLARRIEQGTLASS